MMLVGESTSEGPNYDYHNLNTVGPRKLTAHYSHPRHIMSVLSSSQPPLSRRLNLRSEELRPRSPL
ncbi:hypothetical protein NEOLEDRAFT_1143665, partial [Neolentinus lepideus HHB14362 ss-1]